MQRRKLLAALGALGAGGAAAGTGAFTETSADRSFQLQVTGDASAYLGVSATSGPNGNYVDTTSAGEFAIDLTGSNDNIGDGIAGGEGVNSNGFTFFDRVFRVENQGTQEIDVEISPLILTETSNGDALVVTILPLFAGRVTLGPGEAQTFDLFAFDAQTGNVGETIDETVQITAEAA